MGRHRRDHAKQDSIKEIKVVTNNYDAENGRYRGAQVQIISQNGTNQLRGSAFFKWDRPGLNSFQKYNGYGKSVTKNTSEFNDFGGTVGGPILKDKLFGFFSYETLRQPQSANTVQGWYQTPQYMALAAPGGSAAEKFLTFPGSSPTAGSVLMGAGDGHTCGDIGLTDGINCRFIPGQGLDVGRPLTLPLGARDPSFAGQFSPGLGGDGTGSPIESRWHSRSALARDRQSAEEHRATSTTFVSTTTPRRRTCSPSVCIASRRAAIPSTVPPGR